MSTTKTESAGANAKHTPGPWETDGVYVWRSELDQERILAKVQTSEVRESVEACWANARLIAAAPKMFKKLVEFASETLDEEALAIIAEVEGK